MLEAAGPDVSLLGTHPARSAPLESAPRSLVEWLVQRLPPGPGPRLSDGKQTRRGAWSCSDWPCAATHSVRLLLAHDTNSGLLGVRAALVITEVANALAGFATEPDFGPRPATILSAEVAEKAVTGPR